MQLRARRNEVNMLSGSVFKGLIRVTIPIMIMNVFQSIFNFIDMTMIGNFAGDSAVGSVGACGTLINVFTSLLIGIAVGANAVVARYIATGDEERKEKAIGTSMFLVVFGGLLLMALGVIFARTFLKWMNVSESLLDGAEIYFKLYFVGCPLLLLYNFCANILRSAGDTKRPMYFLILGGVLKITTNYLFLRFTTNFAVQGVAIATIVSWSVTGGLCFSILLRGKGSVKFKWKRFGVHKKELIELLRIGVPTGIYTMAYGLANVIIASTVNSFGEHATEGMAIANVFDGIIYQISHAASFAVLPFISQNYSVHNSKRVKETIYKGSVIALLFCGVFGSLSAIFAPQLSSLMSTTPEVIEYSTQKMIVASSLYFICGVQDVLASALRGIGKPTIPTIGTLIFTCALRFFWVYCIFPFCPPSLTFLYLVWPIGWLLNAIMMGVAFTICYKKKMKEYDVVKAE